ncbi:Uma2 family endonuclease [Actinoplanes sp. URMC 104]|uniref:Uma2 family endonuclease n=1 Tax=Actinoplanes sp. URMC 104 TaxID=3423409 RepID=UPI003F1B6F6F
MTEAHLDHLGPWTEEEYLALDETTNRIELIDGGLWVSPGPNVPHQGISQMLFLALRKAAREAGLKTFEAINVKAGPSRILIPDLAVVGLAVRNETVVAAADVTLVAEIVWPSSRAMDKVQKKALYAEAGIGWYLLLEPALPDYDEVTLQLFRLRDGRYVEAALAKHGETLTSDEPFPIAVDTGELVAF